VRGSASAVDTLRGQYPGGRGGTKAQAKE